MRIIAGNSRAAASTVPTGTACGRRPTSCARRCSTCSARTLAARASSTAMPAPARSASRRSAGARRTSRSSRAIRGRRPDRGEPAALRRHDRYAIIRAEFAGVAARLLRPTPAEPEKEAGQFDVIFLDPPYGAEEMAAALAAAARLASPDTRVVIEHARRDAAPAEAGQLRLTRSLPSGDSALAFYRSQ